MTSSQASRFEWFVILAGLVIACAVLAMKSACGAGLAGNDNFIVYTPTEAGEDAYAQSIVEEAERFRRDFSAAWLGELAPQLLSVVYVDFSAAEDSGLTWAKDVPDREGHLVWLTTTRERAVGSTLRHEIVHTVLASAYQHPHRLPSWCEEGIAVRFDDAERKLARKETLRWWLANHRVPRLVDVFSRHVEASDDDGYTASGLLVDYLLTLGDKPTVVRCGALCRESHERAFAECYGVTLEELQRGWEVWIRSRA